MSSILTALITDQATDRSTITDRTSLLKLSHMPMCLLISSLLKSIFWPSLFGDVLGWRYVRCKIDESKLHASVSAWLSHHLNSASLIEMVSSSSRSLAPRTWLPKCHVCALCTWLPKCHVCVTSTLKQGWSVLTRTITGCHYRSSDT
jgi:hypothetical protein